MYCVTLMTPNPDGVSSALRRARVKFTVIRTRETGSLKGAQNPDIAQRIYDRVAAGITYGQVADEFQVSWHTVLRVAHNPKKYGVDRPPIRRLK